MRHSLNDEGVTTTCHLRTYNSSPAVDFGFRNHDIVNKIIIKVCVRKTRGKLILSPVDLAQGCL